MKMVFLAAAAMIATPLVAQTTPAGSMPPSDQSTMTPPAGQTAPATDPNAATPPAMPADSSMATPPAAAPATDPSMAASAPTGKLPWCRKGQFTACREHENAQGKGLSKN